MVHYGLLHLSKSRPIYGGYRSDGQISLELPYIAPSHLTLQNPRAGAADSHYLFAPSSPAAASSKMAPKKDKAPPPSSKPAKSGGGKQKKKKWSKGKQKEKVNNAVLFDQATYDKMLTEVPKFKQITPSILSERLRVNGSLARRAIKELMARGLIRMVAVHSSQQIYTRATNT
ncbi:hypothetical protein PR202_gb06017 [Eleusine coracana subsp. coracana]|uniref:40S ribosomal protein S25 n=2 Tax=Eleusine coracana subsp. coracana TaxID=191504 RepID=A0AAV5E8A8_ELECO|nr:hypothetical protein PR202_gb06017 [Eleusine coracana subsp. coracana]